MTPEFLYSIESTGLALHDLKLKTNMITMLMRNLDILESMCNETHLVVIELCDNAIKAKIITGEKAVKKV